MNEENPKYIVMDDLERSNSAISPESKLYIKRGNLPMGVPSDNRPKLAVDHWMDYNWKLIRMEPYKNMKFRYVLYAIWGFDIWYGNWPVLKIWALINIIILVVLRG